MQIIDQGLTGCCASAAVTHALLLRNGLTQLEPDVVLRNIYFAAQRRDRFGGGEYPEANYYRSGTTLVDSLGAATETGYLLSSRRLRHIDEVISSLSRGEAVVAGINWHLTMLSTDKSCIESTGPAVGRHSIVIARNSNRFQRDYPYRVINSFGRDWGWHGTAALSTNELDAMATNGEFHSVI